MFLRLKPGVSISAADGDEANFLPWCIIFSRIFVYSIFQAKAVEKFDFLSFSISPILLATIKLSFRIRINSVRRNRSSWFLC